MRLQHDPRTKQQIKDTLYEYMYGPALRHYKQRINKIILANCRLINSAYESFNYKGTLYVTDAKLALPRKANRLHPSLVPEMEAYLAEIKRLNDVELPYVLGYITRVLNSSNHLQDYLKLFPDSLHPPIKQIINSCPCRSTGMPDAEVRDWQETHQELIDLIKQRLVLNLIL